MTETICGYCTDPASGNLRLNCLPICWSCWSVRYRPIPGTTRPSLPERVLSTCRARGYSIDWTERAAVLHLEASELIEAVRGKRGDPTAEAADVLFVLMSITQAHGIEWADVLAQVERMTQGTAA
jgi:hypothetical protein